MHDNYWSHPVEEDFHRKSLWYNYWICVAYTLRLGNNSCSMRWIQKCGFQVLNRFKSRNNFSFPAIRTCLSAWARCGTSDGTLRRASSAHRTVLISLSTDPGGADTASPIQGSRQVQIGTTSVWTWSLAGLISNHPLDYWATPSCGLVLLTLPTVLGCVEWKLTILKESKGNEGTCVGVAVGNVRDYSHRTTKDMWLYRAYSGNLYHGGELPKALTEFTMVTGFPHNMYSELWSTVSVKFGIPP